MINKTPRLFSPEAATVLVDHLNKDADDIVWTYKVKHDPTGIGYCLIEIYDEDNILIGYL